MSRQRNGHGVARQATRGGSAVGTHRAASQVTADQNLREVQARCRFLGDLYNGGQTRLARQRLACDGISTRLAHGVFEGYLYEVKVTHIENSEDQQKKQGHDQGELNESLPSVPLEVSPRSRIMFSHATAFFHLRLPSLIKTCLESRAAVSGAI